MPIPLKPKVKGQPLRIKKICYYFLFLNLSFFIFLTIGYFTPLKTCHGNAEKCNFTLCVAEDGMHTNIVLPVKNKIVDWHKLITIADLGKDRVNNYKYLAFGWGDRDFYIQTPTLADLNLVTAFKALFLPTPSTILVQGLPEIPKNTQNKCVNVGKTDYLKLTQFLKNTFELNPEGNPIKIANGHSSNSGFYQAKGSYSILRNCNNWTAEALRKANVDTPLWAGLSSAIMLHFGRSCACKL